MLCLSQSAASKALAQAEHSLGLKLFDRVRGRLVSTREAEQLFVQTSLLFAQAETVQRLARNLRCAPGGHLRIGCLPSLGIGLIPAAISVQANEALGSSLGGFRFGVLVVGVDQLQLGLIGIAAERIA